MKGINGCGQIERVVFLCALALSLALLNPKTAVGAVSDPESFSVTVPTRAPCSLMPDGSVVAPSGLEVRNEWSGDVVLKCDLIESRVIGCAVAVGGETVMVTNGTNAEYKPGGVVLPGKATSPLSLKVPNLSYGSDAQLIEEAGRGETDFLKFYFRFAQHALDGRVVISPTEVIPGRIATATYEAASGTGQMEDMYPSYRWIRDGEPIPGASSATYMPSDGDVGHNIWCEVSDGGGTYSGSVTSDSMLTVHPNVFKGTLSIPDSATAGDAISATFTPDMPFYDGTPVYQWYRLNRVTEEIFYNDIAMSQEKRVVFDCGENAIVDVVYIDSNPIRNGTKFEIRDSRGSLIDSFVDYIPGESIELSVPAAGRYELIIVNTDPFEHTYRANVTYDKAVEIPGATQPTYTTVASDNPAPRTLFSGNLPTNQVQPIPLGSGPAPAGILTFSGSSVSALRVSVQGQMDGGNIMVEPGQLGHYYGAIEVPSGANVVYVTLQSQGGGENPNSDLTVEFTPNPTIGNEGSRLMCKVRDASGEYVGEVSSNKCQL